MITHNIIVRKPIISLPAPRAANSVWPGQYTYPTTKITQAELDQFLDRSSLAEGMFVCNRMHASIPGPYAIHYIMGVIKDVKELGGNSSPTHPKAFHLLQVFPGTPQPWIHFEDDQDHRQLTREEYKQWVAPKHDLLQHYLTEQAAKWGYGKAAVPADIA
jgi:hypothetical protein